MSDAPEDLVLSLLRAIRADISEIKETLRETQMRLYALELNYVSMRPQLDRVAGDVERIKRRLELTEANHAMNTGHVHGVGPHRLGMTGLEEENFRC